MTATQEVVVTIAHENPLLAMGVAAMLAQHSDIRVAGPSAAESPHIDVAVCSYQGALVYLRADRPPDAPRVLIVTEADKEFLVRAALKAGARGYLLIESCADELVSAVRAVARGLHYVCRAVAPSIANTLAQDPLTGRELDVLRLLAEGMGNKQIASRLDIAVGTVKCHVKSILEKLGASTRTQAAAVATRRGLVAAHSHKPAAKPVLRAQA